MRHQKKLAGYWPNTGNAGISRAINQGSGLPCPLADGLRNKDESPFFR